MEVLCKLFNILTVILLFTIQSFAADSPPPDEPVDPGEIIIVIGNQPTPFETFGLTQQMIQEFINSVNTLAFDISIAQSQLLEEERQQCIANIDNQISACQETVWNAEFTVNTGCATIGVIAGFFSGGAPGIVVAVACGSVNTYTAHQASLACTVAGVMRKESCRDVGI